LPIISVLASGCCGSRGFSVSAPATQPADGAETSSDQWIKALCDLVCKWKPLFWAEERGQIISGIGPYLQRRAIERKAYTHREQFVSRGDKAARAQSFRGRMAMLGLYVPTKIDAPRLAALVRNPARNECPANCLGSRRSRPACSLTMSETL
jgi:hypothetical protein